MKIFTILFLVINSINFIHSQNLKAKITYQATLNNEDFYSRLVKDSTRTQVERDAEINAISSSSPMNFHLFISGTEGLYQAEYDLPTKRSLGYKPNRTGIFARHDNIYYTNLETKEKFYQSFWSKEVLVDLDKVNWKLTQESKKIENYMCYKAIADLESQNIPQMKLIGQVVAWYTPEIPTSFGIQKFNGLPGLTLELITDYDKGKVYYTATKIELNPEEEINIKKPKGKKVSEQEYVELIEKLTNIRRSQRQ
ncbi:GLPGLI family protein [Arenibacter certesii]|uniref:GLPGLI family protein n=1 Tax=Arenibacter certesii TaxID=228955 RepID=A0A918MRG2_9FLAO|nr:GLPGLI family protein [Arenibacter certesii]GGW51923.1 GLPGLI family protein [Arenibacter certesii]